MTRPQLIALLLVLVPLAAYRLQRIVTADTWPPSRHLRRLLRDRIADVPTASRARVRRADLFDLMTCPWCLGFWVSLVVVVATDLYVRRTHGAGLPLPVAWCFFTSAIVGKLGASDEDPD